MNATPTDILHEREELTAILAAARDGLVYLPLGGAGEIGMNFYLYGCRGKWLAVECGISFADETMPGLDIIMADPRFIADQAKDLLGIVLTHAHEDHLGAVPYLWRKLQAPLYATPFAAGLLRAKLAEAGLSNEAELNELPLESHLKLGPFAIDFVTVTHSIPEPNALAIRTPFGTVIHTGDWKIDPEPLIGETIDQGRLSSFGDSGVLAMVCDSTNVLVEGEAGSEAEIRKNLTELVGRYDNRVVIACFASNVARIESAVHAGLANGRRVALVGRSLWRMTEIAQNCGYLRNVPPFLTEHDVGSLPRNEVLLICTGSQGEQGSALARIAANEHPNVVLESGDVVLFSSRRIPGNEKSIYRMQNQLVRRGVQIVTDKDEHIHVSGHPARDELARMYRWVRPRIAVPMHGEPRHLIEHAEFARKAGVPEVVTVGNGDCLQLAPGPAKIVGHAPFGRLGVDGSRLIALDDRVLVARRRMKFGGSALVTVVLDRKGRLIAGPQVSTQGLLDEHGRDENIRQAAVAAVKSAVEKLSKDDREDNGLVEDAVRIAVHRSLKAARGKRPLTQVHVVRI